MRFEREEEKEEEERNSIRNKNGLIDYKKPMRKIGFKERNINSELVKKHFFTYNLGYLLKNFKESKTNSKRNQIQVIMIKNRLRDLKQKITNASGEEKKIEKPEEIVDIAENILEFNGQQQGHGLEILIPNQMLSRLQISLAQLEAESNFEKLKNEIR